MKPEPIMVKDWQVFAAAALIGSAIGAVALVPLAYRLHMALAARGTQFQEINLDLDATIANWNAAAKNMDHAGDLAAQLTAEMRRRTPNK